LEHAIVSKKFILETGKNTHDSHLKYLSKRVYQGPQKTWRYRLRSEDAKKSLFRTWRAFVSKWFTLKQIFAKITHFITKLLISKLLNFCQKGFVKDPKRYVIINWGQEMPKKLCLENDMFQISFIWKSIFWVSTRNTSWKIEKGPQSFSKQDDMVNTNSFTVWRSDAPESFESFCIFEKFLRKNFLGKFWENFSFLLK
jgi:hypothetical protein